MQAIGVFDSGVGGLTVLKALKLKWPGENFLYLADTARLPYGSKSPQTIKNYVEQNLKFLKSYPLKAVVIACNTASTVILDQTVSSHVPLFNVIQPGARKALAASKTSRIGILGTRATVLSQAYPKAIQRMANSAIVFQQACPLFVPLVEEGWINDPVTNLIAYRYVNQLMRQQIDTLILGCTHYPVLADSIKKVTGPDVTLIDSSIGIIEDLQKINPDISSDQGTITILCTDISPRLEETIRLLLSGIKIDSIESVDI